MLGCSLGVFIQIAIESVPLIADPDPDSDFDSDLVGGNSGFGCTNPITRVSVIVEPSLIDRQ
mgnify:CR=1 FL=1